MINTKRINSYAGFTFIETLIVFWVLLFLIGLPSLFLKQSYENIVVSQFFVRFEKRLLYTQQAAVVGEKDTFIHFVADTKLAFSPLAESLNVPKALSLTGPEKIIFKQGTGNNGQLSKYSFEWKAKNKRINYQFQMGSGRYVKKIDDL